MFGSGWRARWRRLALIGALAAAGAVQAAPPAPGPNPRTPTPFDDAAGDFSFAVVADLESGYRPGVFDVAVHDLALLRPAFVITVGDQIEGGAEDEARLDAQWAAFDARLAALRAPYFHVGGNHDLANLAERRVWERRYGRRYYEFLYKDVLFLVLDTEDYSPERMTEISRQRDEYIAARKADPAKAAKLPYASLMEARVGEIGDAQSAYFERVIATHPTVRWTVLLMHKPAWRREDGHGLSRIEAALKGRSYTVLSGHLHHYGYSARDGRDYITLGTTGGEFGPGPTPAFDHLMFVRMTREGPSIANLRLDGILDKTGRIPAGGEALCLAQNGPNCKR